MPQIFNEQRGIGLGVFDGVHRGHLELIRTLLTKAQERNLKSCIYTFMNHPAAVSGNRAKISMGLLSDEEEKIERLRQTGVDEVICQEFSLEFAHVAALDFLENDLFHKLHAALIVVGYNYRFGRGREGDVALLQDWARQKGIEVIVIEPVLFGKTSISSSAIRQAVVKGDFKTAGAMLGRDYSLSGIVMPGQKLGGRLGFPTANIKPRPGICLPENGVYVTSLSVGERTYEAVTNIGLRPSVPGALTSPIVETTILNADCDLYGKEIQVCFLHKLRKEQKFDRLEELQAQVRKDIREAEKWHGQTERCWEMARIGSIPIYGIRSERFTGDVISIVFKMPLQKNTASPNALLARVLAASCRRFPSRPQLSRYLDSLYGAGIDSQTESAGDVQIMSFTADALHTWRGQSFPFRDTVELLFDMLAAPDLDEHGLFSEEIFQSERASLISELQTRENDKTKYALDCCLDLLTEGTVQNIKSGGEIPVLREITREDLKEAYAGLMSRSDVSVFIAGNIDMDLTERICQRTRETFGISKRPFALCPGKIPQCYKPSPQNIARLEIKDVEQAKICIAYKGVVPYFSNETGGVTILNNMLGGDVHSLLFDVVREKMGLAYSVFSAPFRYLSSMLLVAGVAPDNVETAVRAMKNQVERLQTDDFDDALYNAAMESVSYSYRAISDDLHSMISYYLNAFTAGRNVSLQNALYFMKDFNREKIVGLAKKLEPGVEYILTRAQTKQGNGQEE